MRRFGPLAITGDRTFDGKPVLERRVLVETQTDSPGMIDDPLQRILPDREPGIGVWILGSDREHPLLQWILNDRPCNESQHDHSQKRLAETIEADTRYSRHEGQQRASRLSQDERERDRPGGQPQQRRLPVKAFGRAAITQQPERHRKDRHLIARKEIGVEKGAGRPGLAAPHELVETERGLEHPHAQQDRDETTHLPDGLHEMHDQEQTDGVTAEADEPLEAGGYVGGVDNGNDRPSHKRYHGGEDAGLLDGDPARSHRAEEPTDKGTEQDESNDQNRQVRRPAFDQRGKDRQATEDNERTEGWKGGACRWGLFRFHPSHHDPNCRAREATLGPTRSTARARLSSCWSTSLP